ncbi:MAG: hypothetical protein Q9198_002365 [Flavoplaca austrocitrina]
MLPDPGSLVEKKTSAQCANPPAISTPTCGSLSTQNATTKCANLASTVSSLKVPPPVQSPAAPGPSENSASGSKHLKTSRSNEKSTFGGA